MGFLTTHVLDTASGRPAAGVRVDLFRAGDRVTPLATTTTNSDGRCDQPLLKDAEFVRGEYELVFHAGDYFEANGMPQEEPKFLDQVVIRFGISDDSEHYHVPLLISPFAYSTYRGS